MAKEKAELTEEQMDEGAVTYWNKAVEAAIRANLQFQSVLSADAYYNQKHPEYGNLVAEFDADEYAWLVAEYGQDCMRSRDFLMSYQRHRNQTFLAEPSRLNFN